MTRALREVYGETFNHTKSKEPLKKSKTRSSINFQEAFKEVYVEQFQQFQEEQGVFEE